MSGTVCPVTGKGLIEPAEEHTVMYARTKGGNTIYSSLTLQSGASFFIKKNKKFVWNIEILSYFFEKSNKNI